MKGGGGIGGRRGVCGMRENDGGGARNGKGGGEEGVERRRGRKGKDGGEGGCAGEVARSPR